MEAERGKGDNSKTGTPKTPADVLREQQAIASALLIGEKMRRSDRAETYGLMFRLAVFVGIMMAVGLMVLFGYARIAGESFNPFPYMIALGIGVAGSAAVAYWGYVESRRSGRGDE